MYRITPPDDGRDVTYASYFAPKLQTIINGYLNNDRCCRIKLRNGDEYEVGVADKGYTRKFLTKLSDIKFLQHYLLYTPKQQMKLIESIRQKWHCPNEILFQGLSKKIITKYYSGVSGRIDHFNEVMYDIFVVNGYENSNGESDFNKHLFIVNSGLAICPYCSEEEIEPTDATKKQIDHFLPKRQYPFLAMSYYNLVPSCGTCNKLERKGTNDPLLSRAGLSNAIVNPYMFNPEWIRYHLKMLSAKPYQNSDFELLLGFKTKNLLDGYNEFFDISDRQARHNNVVAADYRRFMKYAAEHYYAGMNIDAEWLKNAFDYTLAFDSAEDVPEKEMHHKMRHDIFEQFAKLRKSDFYFIKQHPENPVELT